MPDAPQLPPIAPIAGFDGQKIDVQYYLTEQYDDVGAAAQELPAVIESLNELRQAYIEEKELAKGTVARAEAEAYFDLRGTGEGSFANNYAGKLTEDALKMAVALDRKVAAAQENLAKMVAQVSRLSGTISAFEAKVELLRSSEATRRKAFSESTPD